MIDLPGTTGGGVLDSSGTGALTFSSNFTATAVGSKTLTLQGSYTGSNNTIQGMIVDNGSGNVTAVAKAGPSAWVLSGNNGYTGSTTISGGKLFLNGSNATTSISLAGGATLSGSGSASAAATTVADTGILDFSANAPNTTFALGGLTFSGTSAVNLGVATNYTTTAAITLAGDLTVNGAANSVAFNIPGATLSNGTYKLIGYGGSLLGANGLSAFTLGTHPAFGARQVPQLQNNPGEIDLVVAGDVPTWTGAFSSEWSVNSIPSPQNWKLTTGGGGTDYIQGDNVFFDDSATTTTVAITAADVNPTSTTFNNITKTYTLAGPFAIAGSGFVLKNNAGTLTINNANTYTGGTTLNAGTLNINNAAALGATASVFTIAGGIIDNTSGAAITLANNNPIAWTGNFTFTGASDGTHDLNLGAGAVALTASSQVTISAGTLRLDGAISGSGLGFTKSGAGTLALGGTSTYSGTTTLLSGPLTAASNAALGTGTLALTPASGSATASFTSATPTIGGLTNSGAGTASIVLGNIATPAATALSIGSNNSTSTFSGTIADRSGVNAAAIGSVNKVGSGTLTLSGTNSYMGGTTISAGTLAAGSANAFGAGTITLNGGALQSNITGGGTTPTLPNNIQVNAVAGNILSAPTGLNLALSGNLLGSGTVTKTGAFSAILSGDNSAFTGTYVNSASNTFFAAATAASASAVWTLNAGTLSNTASGTQTDNLGALSGTTGGSLGNNSAGSAVTYSIGALNTNTSYAGTIVDSVGGGGTTAITKVGSGTLTLAGGSGNFAYSGVTTVNGGTLAVGGSFGGDGAIQGDIVVNNTGTYKMVQSNIIKNSSIITVNTGGTLDMNGQSDAIGYFAGNGSLINNTSGTIRWIWAVRQRKHSRGSMTGSAEHSRHRKWRNRHSSVQSGKSRDVDRPDGRERRDGRGERRVDGRFAHRQRRFTDW